MSDIERAMDDGELLEAVVRDDVKAWMERPDALPAEST